MQRGIKGGQLIAISTVNNAIDIINRLQNYNVLINSDIFNEDTTKTTASVMFSGFIPANIQISLLKVQVDKKSSGAFGASYCNLSYACDTVPDNITSLFINKTETEFYFDFLDDDEEYEMLIKKTTYDFNTSSGRDCFLFVDAGSSGVYETGGKFTQFLCILHLATAKEKINYLGNGKFLYTDWNKIRDFFHDNTWINYSKSLNIFSVTGSNSTAGISNIKPMTNSYLIRNRKQFTKNELPNVQIFYGNNSAVLTDGLDNVYIESNSDDMDGYDSDLVEGVISNYSTNTRFYLKRLQQITTKIYNMRYKTGRFTNKYNGNSTVAPKDRMFHCNLLLSNIYAGNYLHTKQEGEGISGYDISTLADKIGYLSYLYTGFLKRASGNNAITQEHKEASSARKNRIYDYIIIPYTAVDQMENNIYFNYEIALNSTVVMEFSIKKNKESLLKML